MACGESETLLRIIIFLAEAQLIIKEIKHSCTNRRIQMRVLFYIGFATPANMFNKHNKDNTFWYPDQHSEDGKISYRKATFKTASL